MTNRSAGIRYARALFDVAVKEQTDLETIEQELDQFNELFRTHESLGKVLLNPAVPAPKKRAVIVNLSKSAGMTTVVAKLLVLLAERDRLVILPDLLGAYRDRLLDYRKVVRAEITTATAISQEHEASIIRGLERATGRTVTVTKRLAPEILGGLVARVGSTVYDASVTTQLKRMKERLENV